MLGNGQLRTSSPLQLPTDQPTPRLKTFRGGAYSFELCELLRRDLDAFNRQERTTSFVTLFAVLGTLLRRYGNEVAVVIGTPAPNAEPGVGQAPPHGFTNFKYIRLDLAGNPGFRELLSRAAESTSAAGAEDIGNADSYLSLAVEENAERCRVTIGYDASTLDAEAIARVAGHYQSLLKGVLTRPDAPIENHTILSDEERFTLLEKWNDTAEDYRRSLSVTQMFEVQAARTPQRIAVLAGNQQVTYRTLNDRANQLARHLRGVGVRPGVVVGLCVDRSVDMMVGLLGILKAGGAYLPFDPDFPRDRLEHYVTDSQAPVLVTQQALRSRLPVPTGTVVLLEDERLAGLPTGNIPPLSTPDDLAYVIYTSGSTGKPKGVQVLHDGLSNFLHSMLKELGITAEDTLLAVTTLSFDMHVTELWLPLVVGAHVVIGTREVASDGAALAALLNRTDATFFQATPATYRLLTATGWKGKANLTAITGGEALSPELARQLLPIVKTLWNGYGPTETTVYSTMHRVTGTHRAIPIGRPIANTCIYLLDPHHQPVPIGLPGEVYIGGAGLARGYLGRPDLSAERFLPNPFRPGERMYKTGDRGCYRRDGVIDYLGRLDHQVKVRGFRVELGEVEAALARHPDVRSNVVVARRGAEMGDSLAAYIIPHAARPIDVASLRSHLRASLPDYMVPASFAMVSDFPLTPNGKIDRKALAAQDPVGVPSTRLIVGPRNDIERDLLSIWEEVLPVRPISATDDFFDLGGHSLQAALVMNKVKEKLGHTLPIGIIFEARTVQRMAAVLQHQLEAGSDSCLVPLHPRGSRPPLFLIAGVGGHVFTFHKFARLLGPDQPSYGVKAIGVDGSREPPNRLEEIATRYLDEILTVRPRGPYFVGGYSIGALIAYELAVQMQRRGLSVGPLIVFDRPAPGHPVPLPLPTRMWMHLCNFVKATPTHRRDYLWERLRNLRDRILFTLGLGRYVAPEIEGVNALPQNHLRKVWGALQTAEHRYRPRHRFNGGVMLFESEDVPEWSTLVRQEPLLGWNKWADGPIDRIVVPGGHLDMFHDRNIHRLASALREGIHRWAGRNPVLCRPRESALN